MFVDLFLFGCLVGFFSASRLRIKTPRALPRTVSFPNNRVMAVPPEHVPPPLVRELLWSTASQSARRVLKLVHAEDPAALGYDRTGALGGNWLCSAVLIKNPQTAQEVERALRGGAGGVF